MKTFEQKLLNIFGYIVSVLAIVYICFATVANAEENKLSNLDTEQGIAAVAAVCSAVYSIQYLVNDVAPAEAESQWWLSFLSGWLGNSEDAKNLALIVVESMLDSDPADLNQAQYECIGAKTVLEQLGKD